MLSFGQEYSVTEGSGQSQGLPESGQEEVKGQWRSHLKVHALSGGSLLH